MGRAILEVAAVDPGVDVSAAVEAAAHEGTAIPFRDRVLKVQAALATGPGVVIEFTSPAATMDHLPHVVINGQALVIGTTGLTDEHRRDLEHAARKIAIVQSTNYSIGVNLLWELARQATGAVGDRADIEIIEAHHNRKQDAPSGTALTIAETIATEQAARGRAGWGRGDVPPLTHGRLGVTGSRRQAEIGIHAIRGGDIFGDHTVLFAMDGERIELTHRAHGRQAFARGAVLAAKWLDGRKPGLYRMGQVLGLGGA